MFEEVFYFGGKTDTGVNESKVQRYDMVIGLRPEMVESYKLLHSRCADTVTRLVSDVIHYWDNIIEGRVTPIFAKNAGVTFVPSVAPSARMAAWAKAHPTILLSG